MVTDEYGVLYYSAQMAVLSANEAWLKGGLFSHWLHPGLLYLQSLEPEPLASHEMLNVKLEITLTAFGEMWDKRFISCCTGFQPYSSVFHIIFNIVCVYFPFCILCELGLRGSYLTMNDEI